MKQYHIPINCLFILESQKVGELHTGKNLHEHLMQIGYKNDFFKSFYYNINSKKSFLNTIDTIKGEVEKKHLFPVIHLEAHGNKDGIVIGSSGEQVNWSEFLGKLTEVNILCRNNLIFNTAHCFGSFVNLSLLDMLIEDKRSPFLLSIGPQTDIKAGEILEGYQEFYEELFLTCSFSGAYSKMRAVTDKNYAILVDQFIGKFIKNIPSQNKELLKDNYEKFLMIDLFEDNKKDSPHLVISHLSNNYDIPSPQSPFCLNLKEWSCLLRQWIEISN